MSLPRASNSLRRWPRPSSQLHPSPRLTPASASNCTTLTHSSANRTTSPNKPRPFHSSSSYNATPLSKAPGVKRQAQTRDGNSTFSLLPFYNRRVPGDLSARLERHVTTGLTLYLGARRDGLIPESVSEKTFNSVSEHLIKSSAADVPSAQALQSISQDVESVFTIGWVITRSDVRFEQWLLSSGVLAGARTAILIIASWMLNRSNGPPHRIPLFENLGKLALEERDPRAMVLYAKVLGRREQYQEALELIDHVVRHIYPTKFKNADKKFMIAEVEPPWNVYAWLKEKTGDTAATDDLIKNAALEFQDPPSLVNYAYIMMRKGDYEKYEECMTQAASSGHQDACRKLGNFYYLTSHGRFPRRGEKKFHEGAEKKQSYLSSLFEQVRPFEEYRKLAQDWYELADSHGSRRAALVLALLLREDGRMEQALEFLDKADEALQLRSQVRKHRANWNDPGYIPKIPTQLLDP